MTLDARLPIFLAVLLLTSGCVQTAMLPATQVDTGETVGSISIDEPGVLVIPRLNLQVTQGLEGHKDVTLNLSGVPTEDVVFPGIGITGRYYLTDKANAELQVQGAGLAGWTNLVLVGVQEVPVGDDSWYVGGQVGLINGRGEVISDSSPTARQTHPVIGGSIGYGPIDLGSS